MLSLYRLVLALPLFNLVQCLPRSDPFYAPVPASSLGNPGDIIDHRVANLTTVFAPGTPSVQQTWYVKYVTKDVRGTKVAAVMTIVIPYNPSGRILSYQAAYDSSDLDCSPSYQLGQNDRYKLTEPLNLEMGLISAALDKSWTVIIPDYEGLTAAFTSGLTSGQAVLDSITAAFNSGKAPNGFTSISSASPVALAGYSGGGLATEWAGELLATYAPGLSSSIVAVAAGGLPVNLNNSIAKINGNANNALLIPNALQGLASTYPDFAQFLNSSLIPSKIKDFYYAKDSCSSGSFYSQSPDIFATYFLKNASLGAFTSSSQYKSVLTATGIMGLHGRPTCPTYFFQGGMDEVVDATATTALVNSYCSANANKAGFSLEYTLNSATNHGEEGAFGFPAALQFIQDRFDQKPTVTGCVTHTTEPGSSFSTPSPAPTVF